MATVVRDLFGPGTWGAGGNLVAWVICGAIAAIVGYMARNPIGRRLAAFWARHHAQHAIAQYREALRLHEEAKRSSTE